MRKTALFILLVAFACSIKLIAGELPGTKVISLSNEEMAPLGLTINKGNVEFIDSRLSPNNKTDKPKKVIVLKDRFEFKNLKKNEIKNLPKVSPRLAVTKTGGNSAAYFSQSDDFNAAQKDSPDMMVIQSAQLNNLVAVRLRPDMFGQDVFLWYEPTPDFLAALPGRFKEDIKKELTGTTGIKDDSYFTQVQAPVITGLSVFPNPAVGGRANLNFKLEDSRTFSIYVYDINGNAIRNVQENVYIAGGNYRAQVDLDTLPAGMYLVAVVTDKGEKAVQRIVVL